MSTSYGLKDTDLFKPLKIGKHTIKHRVAQAPATRARATLDGVPTDLMLDYYKQRSIGSAGGLIVTEGIQVSEQGSGWARASGLYTKKQVDAWKIIVDKVHETDTKISAQLWFLGRQGKADELKRLGKKVVAPSVVYMDDAHKEKVAAAGNELHALTLEEIEQVKVEYVTAAKNAIAAGFDFVEVHGANGYLLDEFAHPSTNLRTDKYGGSTENRHRLTLEVLDLVIEAVGKERVGIRLSPWSEFGAMKGATETVSPVVNFSYVASEINKREIAYLSVGEDKHFVPETPETFMSNYFIYEVFSGPILRTGNYSEKTSVIKGDLLEDRTLIGFARHFISTPDLPKRLQNDWPLNDYDYTTFYAWSSQGYTTYPFHDNAIAVETEAREPKALL